MRFLSVAFSLFYAVLVVSLLCHGVLAAEQTATVTYQLELGNLIVNTVAPELAKNPEQLVNVTVKLRLRLDSKGKVKDLKVISSSGNQFVEQTCTKIIWSIKFPPPPQAVIAELGHDFIDMETEFKIGDEAK
jgi:TonB family protein